MTSTEEGRSVVDEKAGDATHSSPCLRLMQIFPVVFRGLRRWQDRAAPDSLPPLTPRHVAMLQQLRGGPVTVGKLAATLGLSMPTVSGVIADLDRAGYIARQHDPADRRRTFVTIAPDQQDVIGAWLDGAANPVARVLDKLDCGEQAAFLKAMDLLEAELRSDGDGPATCPDA
jgi:DNA-binding MarR family transcriptional regulator